MRKRLRILGVALAAALLVGLWGFGGRAAAAVNTTSSPAAGAVVHDMLQPSAVAAVTAGEAAASKWKSSWSWYVARASGILAAILLGLLVLSGVGMLTGATYKALEPLPAWAMHRAVGLSMAVMVVIHIVVLLFDKFVGFSVVDILVPFASDYKPVVVGGSSVGLWVALGVLAFYAILTVVISSLLWMQSKPRPWRALHYLGYFILAASFIHGLFLGTDLSGGFLRVLWILGGVSLLVAIAPRLQRINTIGKRA